MGSPDLVKMPGRPKFKRIRQKDEVIKRQGEWENSRKGRIMTCNNCGEPNHNVKGCKKPANARPMKKSRTLIDKPDEINLTAPQFPESDFEFPESSRSRSSKPDATMGQQTVHLEATMRQQTVHPDLPINFPNHDPDPTIRPRVVSENTIFEAWQQGQHPSGIRIINFTGDHNGVSVASNLPYSPANLKSKGNAAVTQGQLEMQSRQKFKNSKPRKGQG
ncbi:hypothetical protein RND71_039191 [Anisodus tanguticus]|uniref:Uncharacterized protein n=1 Tax=Anisodus tanguticus TaxID=243964 RepID=A0AAE1UXI5_9SOLA|nr:hypothetical protein RND71_039191 [Anisodus tanguticus]